jgi:hypothetical protein
VPCPFASAVGAVTAAGGVHSLLFRDRRFRRLAWATLILLAAGWTAYFAAFRTPPVRIALEAASVAAVIAAALRVRHLMRAHGFVPPLHRPASRLLRATWPVLGSPGVLVGKVWLLAMLVMEWRGRARFAAAEYALVVAATLALAALRVVSLRRARRAEEPARDERSPSGARPDRAGPPARPSIAARGPRHRGAGLPAARPPHR